MKACPFCKVEKNRVLFAMVYWVACQQCGAFGPTASTEDAAIAAWEARHGDE